MLFDLSVLFDIHNNKIIKVQVIEFSSHSDEDLFETIQNTLRSVTSSTKDVILYIDARDMPWSFLIQITRIVHKITSSHEWTNVRDDKTVILLDDSMLLYVINTLYPITSCRFFGSLEYAESALKLKNTGGEDWVTVI